MRFDIIGEFDRKSSIPNFEWFNSPIISHGSDFSDKELKPGMMFSYKGYTLILGELQFIKSGRIDGILCFIYGRITNFKSVISIKIIKKSLYIGSSCP